MSQKPIPHRLEAFFKKFKASTYKRGETIIRAGEEPSGIFYIASGFVRMNFTNIDGKEFTINIFSHGMFFPAAWLVTNDPSQYFFEAITKTTIIKTRKKDTYDFIKSDKTILLSLAENILSETNGFLARFPKLILGNSRTKVASILLFLTQNFSNLPLSHKDISSLAGLSRETTSLELTRLNREEIITTSYKNIKVIDIKKLEDIAQSEP